MRRKFIYGFCCLLVTTLTLAIGFGGGAKSLTRRLAGWDRDQVQFTFSCPRGENHQLLLGMPYSDAKRMFSGHVTVKE